MKLQTKKRIAKEIIILLCGIILCVLIFLCTYPYNWIINSKLKNADKIVLLKQNELDSIESTLDLGKILQKYVATANNPEYKSDWNLINSKFPELNNINKNLLQEYVATANNPVYGGDWNIINSKFPEFVIQSKYYRTFKVENEIVDIPVKNVDTFLHDYPNAIEIKSYLVDKDTFDIPLVKEKAFLRDNPKASLIRIVGTSNKDLENIELSKRIKIEITKLITQNSNRKQKLLSIDDQLEISWYLFIIIFIILYPIRFLYRLIIWSLRTIKQN